MTLPALRDLIDQHFSDEELRLLCFDLAIEYENLPGATRIAKSQALVAYCLRHNRLPELGAQCRQLRPDADWPDLEVLAADVGNVQEEIATREKLVGILREDELEGILTPLRQKEAHLLAQLTGGGAIAQGEGAQAVGERGVLVEGDVSGDIITGDKSSVGISADSITSTNVVGGDQHVYQLAPENLTSRFPDHWESHYLRALLTHCDRLDMTPLAASEATTETLSIAAVFTTLYLENVYRTENETVTDALTPLLKQEQPQEKD